VSDGRRQTGAGDLLLALALAGALLAVAFLTTGGTDLAPNTWVEIALTVIGVGTAGAVLLTGRGDRRSGGMPLLLFGALAALTYASIAWSVAPDVSWVEANRTLSYLSVFAVGIALARLAPGRWPAIVGAVALAATAVCSYTLLAKVFPASLDPTDALGRLQVPFGYFNATGAIAALGLVPSIWAGTHRDAPLPARALSAPAIAILSAVLVLSYSRGALVAAAVGLACWFALAPLRLRSAAILALGVAGGAVITAWALGRHALVGDDVALHARTAAGHSFGLVLLVVLAVVALLGGAVGLTTERVALSPRTRRRLSTALVVLVALVPLGGVAALAASSRGFTGEVSHLWTRATSGSVGNNPGRLGQLGSSRGNYWRVGVKVGEHALLGGVGARGYETARPRYTPSLLQTDAHSYVVETFADLGLVGLVLNLALLAAWAIAAGRTLGAATDRSGERAGLVALLSVVVVFGVHSAIDLTWFIPGVAVPALLCAGWLAGRGPLSTRNRTHMRPSFSPGRAAALVGLAALTLAAAWVIWQPLRSSQADAAAIAALSRGDGQGALTNARAAVTSDPVSAQALWILANVYGDLGRVADAHRELVQATSVQPSNPTTWETLGIYDLRHGLRSEALSALREAHRLEPFSPQVAQELASAQRL
jgi:tetratricopeptide (TPR) repeat protein